MSEALLQSVSNSVEEALWTGEGIRVLEHGQLLRSEAYHAIDGRAHVDFGHSFIAKEEDRGIDRSFEDDGDTPADLSGSLSWSAISAIQIRQSMDDEVLVPWKKNRLRM